MNNLELAKNPNTPPETLDILTNDVEWGVRCGLQEIPTLFQKH